MTAQRDSPAVTRACQYCSLIVITFTDELGCHRMLDVHEIPSRVDVTAPHVRGRVWELSVYKSIGWQLMDLPRRSWRPIRLEHACTGYWARITGQPMSLKEGRP